MIHFLFTFFDFFRVWYYNIRMFNRRFALALIIFLLTLSAGFAKPKKKGVTVPTKVQEKIIPLIAEGKSVLFQSETTAIPGAHD